MAINLADPRQLDPQLAQVEAKSNKIYYLLSPKGSGIDGARIRGEGRAKNKRTV